MKPVKESSVNRRRFMRALVGAAVTPACVSIPMRALLASLKTPLADLEFMDFPESRPLAKGDIILFGQKRTAPWAIKLEADMRTFFEGQCGASTKSEP